MVKLDIISDPICPWCYIGKANLDRALEAAGDHPFEIEWHPFQLNPDMPAGGMDRREYLELKFGGKEGAIKAYAPVVEAAGKAGLQIDFAAIGRTPNTLDAHRLIEEFMIQANVAAAETLEQARQPLIYRVHDEPALEKMRALGEVLASVGIKLPKEGALRPALFNRILATAAETEHGVFLNEVILRSQAQAVYAPENLGHFGLNLRRYAHFTSPIRRYADLIVHRTLITACRLGSDGLASDVSLGELAQIGEQISAAERRAMAAERETIDRLIAHHLADQVGATFAGQIAGVTRAGLFIKLDETGADGFVPVSQLGADYFRHEEGRHALVGERTGETFRLGDRLEVRLVEAAPVAGALRFELLSEGRTRSGGRTAGAGKKAGGRAFKAAPPGRPPGIRNTGSRHRGSRR